MTDYQEQEQQQPQPPAGQPFFPAVEQEQAPVLSMMDWVVVLILTALPIVNIVMLIIWAVGGNVNPNKKNYAKAALIMAAISILIWVAFLGRIVATFFGMMNHLSMGV